MDEICTDNLEGVVLLVSPFGVQCYLCLQKLVRVLFGHPIRHSHLGFVYICFYLAGSHFITKTNPESHFQE